MPSCFGITNVFGNLTVSGELDAHSLALHLRNILMPVGTIVTYAAPSAPDGFLFCNGATVSRTEYADLFAVIGDTFGAGNGTTTFNLPNFSGRFVMGCDASHSYSTAGGQGAITLSVGQMPSHRHTITVTDPGHVHGLTDPGHTHAVTDPGHNHTVTDPGHTHSYNDTVWCENRGQGNNLIGTSSATDYDNDPYFVSRVTGSASTGISVNTRTTGLTVNSSGAGISVNSGSTNITASNSLTGSGEQIDITNPYLALYYMIRY